jgi:hypothetical protein
MENPEVNRKEREMRRKEKENRAKKKRKDHRGIMLERKRWLRR